MDGGQNNDFTSSTGILTTVGDFVESFRLPCDKPAPDTDGRINPCDLQQDVSIPHIRCNWLIIIFHLHIVTFE